MRAPKGTYILNTSLYGDPQDATKGIDWIAQPKLTVAKKQTLTIDARKAKPVDITVPAAGAKSVFASPGYDVRIGDNQYGYGWFLDTYKNFRSAHLGPQLPAGSLRQQWDAHWSKGANEQYDVTSGGPVKQLATGYTKHYKASELATVKARLGAPAKGKKGSIDAVGWLPGSTSASSVSIPQSLPATRTLHLSATGGVQWQLEFQQNGGLDQDGFPVTEAGYGLGQFTFKAGKTYTKTVNTAVFGPRLGKAYGLFRDGNEIFGSLPLFADSAGHAGYSQLTSVNTTLYRNGTKVGSNTDPLFGEKTFKVPAGDAAYKLTTSVQRSSKMAEASTRIDAAWTFRSKKPAGFTQLPASALRFGATTGLDSRVAAGKTVTFPVTVEGSAAGRNLKSLAVYVSYDGKNFKKVTVKNGKITVKNPAKNKAVSFRTKITDKKGNTSEITIYNAYFGK
ncbi:hypothetical protein LT493_33790 [Streptomyces tricolor]|nr:hypothetical protein [Streptomyces tricolor]